MKMIPPSGQKKQTQFKPNFPPIQLISVAIDVNIGSYNAGFQQPNITNPIFLQVVYELGTFSNFS